MYFHVSYQVTKIFHKNLRNRFTLSGCVDAIKQKQTIPESEVRCGLVGRVLGPSGDCCSNPSQKSKTEKLAPVASLVSVYHLRTRTGIFDPANVSLKRLGGVSCLSVA